MLLIGVLPVAGMPVVACTSILFVAYQAISAEALLFDKGYPAIQVQSFEALT